MLSGRSVRPLHRLFSTSAFRNADPWPLPHTRQHMEATTIPPSTPKPIPVPRHNESLNTLRARLTYQTRKRGTLESDLIMSTFAKEHLNSLTREELLELDQVMLPENALSSLPANWIRCSCWTSPTGTCTIGAPRERRLRSVGTIHQFSRNLKFMPGMKARPFAGCLILSHHGALRE